MTHNNAEDCGQRSPGRAVREEGAIPDNPADAEDGQDFLCAICDGVIFERINSCGKHICELVWLEAVKQEIVRFIDELAVPDLRETMACTSALERYITQVDDALEAERTAVKDESVKLSATVEQLMSKLSSIQASFTAQ